MAAPIRSAISRSGRPSAASLRRLSSAHPVKAQVKPISVREPSTPSDVTILETSVRRAALSRTYFDATGVRWVGAGDDGPKDPNKAKLGKSTKDQDYGED